MEMLNDRMKNWRNLYSSRKKQNKLYPSTAMPKRRDKKKKKKQNQQEEKNSSIDTRSKREVGQCKSSHDVNVIHLS